MGSGQNYSTDLRHETALLAPTIRRLRRARGQTPVDVRLVLVASDDERFRAALHRILGLQGFSTRTAATASQAIDVIRAERPAAVIVDLGEDGLDVAVAMPLPQPVLLLSSSATTGGNVARIRPRTKFMTKPCSIVLLVEAVQQMLASADEVSAGTFGSLPARSANRVAEFPPAFLRP